VQWPQCWRIEPGKVLPESARATLTWRSEYALPNDVAPGVVPPGIEYRSMKGLSLATANGGLLAMGADRMFGIST
jgi:hypothetical protein